MSSWMFVMKGDRKDFLQRLKSKNWPIYRNTGNRKRLKKNDSVVFYLGGEKNKVIMGTAKIASHLREDADTDFAVEISDVTIFRSPLPIHDIVDSIRFIRNKRNWGCYLQGGVIEIPSTDLENIKSYNKKG